MPRKKAGRNSGDRWMISYADLLTLMLAFFVVLYSQSSIDLSRLKEIARGMTLAFHGTPQVMTQKTPGSSGILKHHESPIEHPIPHDRQPASPVKPIHRKLRRRVAALDRAESELKHVLAPLLTSGQVHLIRKPLSLKIRLNTTILFPTGSARLSDQASALLVRISGVLNKLPHDFPLVIEGYTDKRPIRTPKFHSNWELSTARALSVLELFQDNGLPGHQLAAEGFSKYHPLKQGSSPAALQANRRVAIVVEAPGARRLDQHVEVDPLALNSTKLEKQQIGHPNAGSHSGRGVNSSPMTASMPNNSRATSPPHSTTVKKATKHEAKSEYKVNQTSWQIHASKPIDLRSRQAGPFNLPQKSEWFPIRWDRGSTRVNTDEKNLGQLHSHGSNLSTEVQRPRHLEQLAWKVTDLSPFALPISHGWTQFDPDLASSESWTLNLSSQ